MDLTILNGSWADETEEEWVREMQRVALENPAEAAQQSEAAVQELATILEEIATRSEPEGEVAEAVYTEPEIPPELEAELAQQREAEEMDTRPDGVVTGRPITRGIGPADLPLEELWREEVDPDSPPRRRPRRRSRYTPRRHWTADDYVAGPDNGPT
ncbi:hypothetical protein DD599_25950 [Enterobacter cloacae complex sp. CH23B]|nr:hypothetical protein DD599_25950 [Enterobacter cloacae complex sp. CH23B]